jgi:hypothetical protein
MSLTLQQRRVHYNVMESNRDQRIAILYPGSREARDAADPKASRFAALFDAFEASGIAAEPAIYNDDFAAEVEQQLVQVEAVLVWHNPIEGGRTRQVLDALLRKVAAQGVLVSTHPDTILRLGTKDVLLDVRDLPFGSDAHAVANAQDLATTVRERLRSGPRVLKQHRGHSGIGVWRIERIADERYALRHAQRGATEEIVAFETVLDRLSPYFDAGGHMVDQAWQPRMIEGMTRAYLVKIAAQGSATRRSTRCTQHPRGTRPRPRARASTATARIRAFRIYVRSWRAAGSTCCATGSVSSRRKCRCSGMSTSCSASAGLKTPNGMSSARST